MILITKALCLLIGASNITVLLEIHRSARHRISRSLLLRLLILAIRLQRKLNWKDGVIIVRIGFTDTGGYLIERYLWRGVSGTTMTVRFCFRGGPTTVNRISVTSLHHIMTHLFVFLEIFFVWLVHNNDYFLGYQISDMTSFMLMRLYKSHDLS